jgi:hypothetical protein
VLLEELVQQVELETLGLLAIPELQVLLVNKEILVTLVRLVKRVLLEKKVQQETPEILVRQENEEQPVLLVLQVLVVQQDQLEELALRVK